MERKIYKDLLNWKLSSNRKPLILQGARQVGKTYIVNYFGSKEYAITVYCNFEKDIKLHDFFNDLDPQKIIEKLSAYKRKSILPGYTLLIFDEIQACPQAITSLKYFNEEFNEYHIIAMGSLLGVSVNRGTNSFPVGKVQFMTLYPMDFEEFLMARNENYLIKMIYNSYETNTSLDMAFHERAKELYRQYLFVGGMPEVVEEFNKNNNFDLVTIIKLSILEAYNNDMGKYNKQTKIPKTRLVYKNISTQLAKENKKFQYKYIKSGGRAKEFEEAIEWLCLSGIARQLYRLEQIKLPLESYKSLSDFKLFMNDVGLCTASQDLFYSDLINDNNLLDDFKGGLAENYVLMQLICNGFNLFYWTSDNTAEVDFVTRIGNDIIPIEVKSNINNKSKSLIIYREKYNPKYSIRLSLRNFGLDNGIKSIPLYAAFCIKK